MKRDQWKLLYRDLRTRAKDSAALSSRCYGGTGKPRGVEIATFEHGGTYWQARFVSAPQWSGDRDKGLTCQPRIIRDRSPSARMAEEIAWSQHFKAEGRKSWSKDERSRKYGVAVACLEAARDIRLNASRFWEIAA